MVVLNIQCTYSSFTVLRTVLPSDHVTISIIELNESNFSPAAFSLIGYEHSLTHLLTYLLNSIHPTSSFILHADIYQL